MGAHEREQVIDLVDWDRGNWHKVEIIIIIVIVLQSFDGTAWHRMDAAASFLCISIKCTSLLSEHFMLVILVHR